MNNYVSVHSSIYQLHYIYIALNTIVMYVAVSGARGVWEGSSAVY